VNTTQRSALAGIFLAVSLAACAKGGDVAVEGAGDTEKKAHEAAVTDLKQPIALISAYSPYARFPESHDKYTPQRHTDLDKSTLCAANEIRYAANKARQKLEVSSANATKELQSALKVVTEACTDASEPGTLAKCDAAVDLLDTSLAKTGNAAAALGVTAKYPRIAPESVTDEARAQIAPFLKARGPGDKEKAYSEKRADPKATAADVIGACQAAQGDASSAASTFEKADEPIRLVAVTRKMAMDSQCRKLEEVDNLGHDLHDCRKKAKIRTLECKIVCGKAKNWIDEGFPAAAFAPIEKDYGDICGKS